MCKSPNTCSPIKTFQRSPTDRPLVPSPLHYVSRTATTTATTTTAVVSSNLRTYKCVSATVHCLLVYVELCQGLRQSMFAMSPSLRPARPLMLCAGDETFYRTNESGTRQRDQLECTRDSQLLTATLDYVQTVADPEHSLLLSLHSISRPLFTISHISP